MAGELLRNHKIRCMPPWQGLSEEFKHADLKTLSIADGVSFNHAIDRILVAADSEGRRPTRVPLGYLAERVEVKNSHTYARFYGQPKSWMSQFAPQGRAVKRINRLDSNGNIAGIAYGRAGRTGGEGVATSAATQKSTRSQFCAARAKQRRRAVTATGS